MKKKHEAKDEENNAKESLRIRKWDADQTKKM